MAKPAPGTGLNLSNSIAATLKIALAFNEGSGNPHDAAGGVDWTLSGATGTPTWTTSTEGDALAFVQADGQYLQGPALSGMTATAWTLIWTAQGADAAGAIYSLLGANPSAGDSFVRHRPAAGLIELIDASGNGTSASYSGANQAAFHTYVLAAGTSTWDVYVDGTAVGSPVAWTGTFNWGSAAKVAQGFDGIPGWDFDGTIGHVFLSNAKLDATQAASITSDPWQVYATASPKVPFGLLYRGLNYSASDTP